MQMPPLLTAMVTPFDDSLEVNYEAAKDLAAWLVDNGSDGLVVCGTTGECPTLTHAEKVGLFRAVVESVGDRAYVVAGTGTYDTRTSEQLTREAEDAGVHAVMLTTPYYNKPPQDCLVRHFETLANATSLPVILYNVPTRTVTKLEPATAVKLAREVGNIVALKDAGSNINDTMAIRRDAPEDFLIYSGNDGETLPILAVGGHGVISVASHVAGRQIHAMLDAFAAGDLAEARKLHLSLLPVYDAMFLTTSPIPVKAACAMLGLPVGGLRPPLYEALAPLKERIAGVLRQHGIL